MEIKQKKSSFCQKHGQPCTKRCDLSKKKKNVGCRKFSHEFLFDLLIWLNYKKGQEIVPFFSLTHLVFTEKKDKKILFLPEKYRHLTKCYKSLRKREEKFPIRFCWVTRPLLLQKKKWETMFSFQVSLFPPLCFRFFVFFFMEVVLQAAKNAPVLFYANNIIPLFLFLKKWTQQQQNNSKQNKKCTFLKFECDGIILFIFPFSFKKQKVIVWTSLDFGFLRERKFLTKESGKKEIAHSDGRLWSGTSAAAFFPLLFCLRTKKIVDLNLPRHCVSFSVGEGRGRSGATESLW